MQSFQEQTPFDVRDFKAPADFKDLNFSEVDPFGYSEKEIYEIVLPIQINGVVFNLLFEIEKREGEDVNFSWHELKISVFDKNKILDNVNSAEESILHGEIMFDLPTRKKDNLIKAYTIIKRNKDKSAELPAGVGVEFYKKMLDFISNQAATYRKTVIHLVSHDPEMGLDPDKWTKIFEPLLKERGYEDITVKTGGKNKRWEKAYYSQQKQKTD